MGATDRGDQILSTDYQQSVNSDLQNYSFHEIIKPGIFRGLELTKIDNTTVQISTGVMYIKDTTHNLSIKIETTSNITDQAIDSTDNYIVARFVWSSVTNNYCDFFNVAVGDIEADDIIIGKGNFSGSTLVDFDYSDRSVGNLLNLTIDTNANLTSANNTLMKGEGVFAYDTGYFTIGDGSTAFNDSVGIYFDLTNEEIYIPALFVAGTEASLQSSNPVLKNKQLSITLDSGIIKVGDGSNNYNDLPQFQPEVTFATTADTVLTAANNYSTILVTTGSSVDKTITLPDASTVKHRKFTIKKVDSGTNDCIIDTTSGNIDGAASVTLSTQYSSVTVQSDGTNYWKIAEI